MANSGLFARYGYFIAFTGFIGLMMYPTIIEPYFNQQKWRD